MVNYSWGDKWDERQKKEDEKRFYGPGSYYGGGGSSGGGKGYTSYPRRGGHTGRNIGIVVLAVVVVGGLVFLFNPLGIDFLDNAGNIPDIPDQIGLDVNDNENGRIVETVVETKQHNVLSAGAFLSGNDVRSFNLQIPNKDVSRLEGTITVDGEEFVNVEFQDNFGGLYCDQCSYEVYGERSGKAQNNNVDIPIDSGDSLKLFIANGGDAELQTVSINLYVAYEESVERVVQPVVEEEPEPEVTPVVEEEPEPEEPATVALTMAPQFDFEEMERQIHDLINEEREARGLDALSYDEELSDIAQEHSEDMAENNFFEHVNLRGEEPTDRAERNGYDCTVNMGSFYYVGIAENIMQGWRFSYYWTYAGSDVPIRYEWYSQEELAQNIVEGWMDSPGHRENILTEHFSKEGLGLAYGDDWSIYATQNFC